MQGAQYMHNRTRAVILASVTLVAVLGGLAYAHLRWVVVPAVTRIAQGIGHLDLLARQLPQGSVVVMENDTVASLRDVIDRATSNPAQGHLVIYRGVWRGSASDRLRKDTTLIAVIVARKADQDPVTMVLHPRTTPVGPWVGEVMLVPGELPIELHEASH
jgi:hypothetical protein